VGTEHILLGLLMDGDGIAARVLCELGLNLEGARDAITTAQSS
jgi:ATP-dependent Clp protease ATP-binding subunit ClpC